MSVVTRSCRVVTHLAVGAFPHWFGDAYNARVPVRISQFQQVIFNLPPYPVDWLSLKASWVSNLPSFTFSAFFLLLAGWRSLRTWEPPMPSIESGHWAETACIMRMDDRVRYNMALGTPID